MTSKRKNAKTPRIQISSSPTPISFDHPVEPTTPDGPPQPADVVEPWVQDQSRPVSATARELRSVTPAMALMTLKQLIDGYAAGSGMIVPAAETNSKGCVLARKVANRAVNGYIQIPPIGFLKEHRTGAKTLPQNAHRLAVIAHKSKEDADRLLYGGYHASHLCHEPLCILANHIHVESKRANEARKMCKGRLLVRTTISGVRFRLDPKPCLHDPPCLADIEQREAVALNRSM